MNKLSAKFRAWMVHLLLSFCVLLPILLLIFFRWFPYPFFSVQNAGHVVALLVGLQLVFIPFLTFVVYAPRKKGLKFDLSVIALVQLAALLYGVYAIYSERPTYVVFAVDRYVPLAAKDVSFAGTGLEGFGEGRAGEPAYAFAELPMGQAYENFQNSVLFGGQPDLERRPEFWIPLETGREAILSSAMPLLVLMEQRPASAKALSDAAMRTDQDPAESVYVPMPGKRDDFAAILDPDTGKVIAAVAVENPWLN